MHPEVRQRWKSQKPSAAVRFGRAEHVDDRNGLHILFLDKIRRASW